MKSKSGDLIILQKLIRGIRLTFWLVDSNKLHVQNGVSKDLFIVDSDYFIIGLRKKAYIFLPKEIEIFCTTICSASSNTFGFSASLFIIKALHFCIRKNMFK